MTSLEGSIVDLVTPFHGDGIDDRGFADLVAWQISEGSHGLATCTTTGEGPTLTAAERERLIRICVEVSAGRVPVIAATGTNGTDGTVALTRMAKAAGAQAALVVTPYYNRPSQEGICRHFEAVAHAVDLPIVVHNDPARTGVDLHGSTIDRLRRIPSIAGFCDAGPDPARLLDVASLAADGRARLCGNDPSALVFGLRGGEGVLSVAANVVPKLCATLLDACRAGCLEAALQAGAALSPMLQALQRDDAPATIKYLLTLLRSGFPASLRLPLLGVSDEAGQALSAALRETLSRPDAQVWLTPRHLAADKVTGAGMWSAIVAERAS